MRTSLRILALVVSTCLAMGVAQAADGIESRPLKFAKNTSSATVKGSIKGPQTIDYKLRARSGQTMSVTLKSGNSGLAFNVLPPGSQGEAIAGAIGLQTWSGALPADGEYTVRTYLPRSAARRGEKASYTLTVGITGGTASATAAAGAAAGAATGAAAATQRAGEGKFNATGKIPCAQAQGQPMGQCDYGVARGGSGTATVVVTRPDGRKRFIFFEGGKAVGADLSQADGNMSFRATQQADLYMIQAGNERYEIPDAVINGG
jgi:hypothetical protein